MKKTFLLAACAMIFAVTANAQTDNKTVSKPATAPAAVAPAATSTAEMTFEVEEYNFNTIKQGESVTRDFSFTNTGKEDIIITNAQGSCGCTVPIWPKEPIKKGAKGVIKVTFNSAGKMGLQDKTVTITSNAKNSPRVIHLKGTVKATAVASTEAKPDPTKE